MDQNPKIRIRGNLRAKEEETKEELRHVRQNT
jgi:hypothetical protein